MKHPKPRSRRPTFVMAALLSGMAPFAASAEPRSLATAAQLRVAVDEAVQPLMRNSAVPGVAVAVTLGGEAVVFNYGLQSREPQVPVSDQTLFELGSISKTFVATLGLYAQEQGLLSLSDHPGQYVSALRGSRLDQATLLHLATYTAGDLPLQVPDDIRTDAQMLQYLRQVTPASRPGELRKYSNPSIGLFGQITALAMKQDFGDAMQGTLFPKLGLHHTFIRVPPQEMSHYAWGYNSKLQPVRVKPDVFEREAYGVKATASDLLRFVQLNMRPDGLEPPMKAAVAGTHKAWFRAGGTIQGLGWEQYGWPVTVEALVAGNSSAMAQGSQPVTAVASDDESVRGARLYNKTGGTGGFSAYAAFVPERQIGVVILANRSTPSSDRVTAAHAILQRLDSLRPSLN